MEGTATNPPVCPATIPATEAELVAQVEKVRCLGGIFSHLAYLTDLVANSFDVITCTPTRFKGVWAMQRIAGLPVNPLRLGNAAVEFSEV